MFDLIECGSGDECEDAGGGFGEAFLSGSLIGGVDEAGGEVAMVCGFTLLEFFGGLVEFIEFPLGGGGVEPCEAG